jgi:hypothetical protein
MVFQQPVKRYAPGLNKKKHTDTSEIREVTEGKVLGVFRDLCGWRLTVPNSTHVTVLFFSAPQFTVPRPAKAGFMGCRGFWKSKKDISLSPNPAEVNSPLRGVGLLSSAVPTEPGSSERQTRIAMLHKS